MATLAQEMTETFPVDPLDVSRAELYRDDTWQEPFRRLRAEAPVYRCEHSDYGPYWSISTYKPIVEVESLPEDERRHIARVLVEGVRKAKARLPASEGRRARFADRLACEAPLLGQSEEVLKQVRESREGFVMMEPRDAD